MFIAIAVLPRLIGAFLVVSAAACASAPVPRPAAVDPSNPEAPESPRPILIALEAGPVTAPATPAPVPAPATEKPPTASLYTCPMHPEVVSDKPGRCPKCGMKLVPKETAPPSPAPGGKK